MPAKSASRKTSPRGSSAKKSSGRSSATRSRSSAKKGASKKSARGPKYGAKAQQEVATEMRHMKQGKHPVKNRKQAIAIGLSKARQKGGKVPPKGR